MDKKWSQDFSKEDALMLIVTTTIMISFLHLFFKQPPCLQKSFSSNATCTRHKTTAFKMKQIFLPIKKSILTLKTVPLHR